MYVGHHAYHLRYKATPIHRRTVYSDCLMTRLHSVGILFLLASATSDLSLHSHGGKSKRHRSGGPHILPSLQARGVPPRPSDRPLSQHMCIAFWVSLPQSLVPNAVPLATQPQAEFLRLPRPVGRILIHHLICIIAPLAPSIPQPFLMLKRL